MVTNAILLQRIISYTLPGKYIYEPGFIKIYKNRDWKSHPFNLDNVHIKIISLYINILRGCLMIVLNNNYDLVWALSGNYSFY